MRIIHARSKGDEAQNLAALAVSLVACPGRLPHNIPIERIPGVNTLVAEILGPFAPSLAHVNSIGANPINLTLNSLRKVQCQALVHCKCCPTNAQKATLEVAGDSTPFVPGNGSSGCNSAFSDESATIGTTLGDGVDQERLSQTSVDNGAEDMVHKSLDFLGDTQQSASTSFSASDDQNHEFASEDCAQEDNLWCDNVASNSKATDLIAENQTTSEAQENLPSTNMTTRPSVHIRSTRVVIQQSG